MSTNTIMQQNDISDGDFVAALPEWKRALWHAISAAAHARNAFDNDDYDINGDFNSCSARFAELCTWLVCLPYFHPAVKRTTKEVSRTDEHVCRLYGATQRHLRHSGQYGDASLTAVGN